MNQQPVSAINGLFGVNCSKAIQFGPDVDRTLLHRFRVDDKKGVALRHRRAKSKMAATRYRDHFVGGQDHVCSGCNHLFSGKDHFCVGLDIF